MLPLNVMVFVAFMVYEFDKTLLFQIPGMGVLNVTDSPRQWVWSGPKSTVGICSCSMKIESIEMHEPVCMVIKTVSELINSNEED